MMEPVSVQVIVVLNKYSADVICTLFTYRMLAQTEAPELLTPSYLGTLPIIAQIIVIYTQCSFYSMTLTLMYLETVCLVNL